MYSSLGGYGGRGFGSLGSGMYGMGSSLGSGYGSLRPGGEGQQNQQQQQNLRSQYYGMLGGLNSMLQLGFAGISLTVFVKNVGSIIKTCHNWFKTLVTRFGKFIIGLPIIRLIPLLFTKLKLQSVFKPSQSSKFSNKFMFYLRLLALAGIFLILYIRKQMKNQIDKQYEDMMKQNNKQDEQLMEDEYYYYQKQGFF